MKPLRILAAGSAVLAALAAASAKSAPASRPAADAAVKASDPNDLRDATTPCPRRDEGWLFLHKQFVARARQGGVDVLFVGDSIVHGWTGAGKAVWKQEYEPLKAACFGIPADMTQFVLWRLANGELDGIAPKVVVLMIGTNNLKSGPTRMAPSDAVAGVAAVVRLLREKLPAAKVLLLGILHRQPQYPWMAETVRKANALVAKLADGRNVRFLDFGGQFLRADETIDPSLFNRDLLHPNAKGYAKWAEAMRGALGEMLKPS